MQERRVALANDLRGVPERTSVDEYRRLLAAVNWVLDLWDTPVDCFEDGDGGLDEVVQLRIERMEMLHLSMDALRREAELR